VGQLSVDVIATLSSLSSLKYIMVYISGGILPRMFWKKALTNIVLSSNGMLFELLSNAVV